VQRLSGWSSGEVSGYDLFLGDVRQADRLAEAVNDALLRSDLPETDGVVAVSVGERYPAVFDWLKAHDVNGGGRHRSDGGRGRFSTSVGRRVVVRTSSVVGRRTPTAGTVGTFRVGSG